jgi:hypothetical protein
MKLKLAIIVVAAALCVACFGLAVVVFAGGDDEGCTKTRANGTSSLHVSERALTQLRKDKARATSDDGQVCR